jgi:hypothetical protein
MSGALSMIAKLFYAHKKLEFPRHESADIELLQKIGGGGFVPF